MVKVVIEKTLVQNTEVFKQGEDILLTAKTEEGEIMYMGILIQITEHFVFLDKAIKFTDDDAMDLKEAISIEVSDIVDGSLRHV